VQMRTRLHECDVGNAPARRIDERRRGWLDRAAQLRVWLDDRPSPRRVRDGGGVVKLLALCLAALLVACGSHAVDAPELPGDPPAADVVTPPFDAGTPTEEEAGHVDDGGADAAEDVYVVGAGDDADAADVPDTATSELDASADAPELVDAADSAPPAVDAAPACVPNGPPDPRTVSCTIHSDGCGGWYDYQNDTTGRYLSWWSPLTQCTTANNAPGWLVHTLQSGCTLPMGCTRTDQSQFANWCCPYMPHGWKP